MSDKLVICEDVAKTFVMGKEKVRALRGVSFDIKKGEYVSIMGPSGSGKSTLFNMIGGLDTPTAGGVTVEDCKLLDLNSSQLAWFRCNKIGFIFQSFNLIPTMTALENVAIPRIFMGFDPEEARTEAANVLERVGLGERLDHLPSQVSGGQQQRIAIARALVNKPLIILADEPTGNLDLHTGNEIINLLNEMKENFNVTIITATHDMKMLSHSDKIIHIEDGAVKRIDTKGNIKVKIGSIDGETVI
jgi:putative ABC transport system ATP-binding protein